MPMAFGGSVMKSVLIKQTPTLLSMMMNTTRSSSLFTRPKKLFGMPVLPDISIQWSCQLQHSSGPERERARARGSARAKVEDEARALESQEARVEVEATILSPVVLGKDTRTQPGIVLMLPRADPRTPRVHLLQWMLTLRFTSQEAEHHVLSMWQAGTHLDGVSESFQGIQKASCQSSECSCRRISRGRR